MANTIPNVIILPDTVTDIYAIPDVIAAGVNVGEQINVAILGVGHARFYTGPTLPSSIDESTGYRSLGPNSNASNDAGDTGAYIYSLLGCVINVQGG